jgi:hypothetical protein
MCSSEAERRAMHEEVSLLARSITRAQRHAPARVESGVLQPFKVDAQAVCQRCCLERSAQASRSLAPSHPRPWASHGASLPSPHALRPLSRRARVHARSPAARLLLYPYSPFGRCFVRKQTFGLERRSVCGRSPPRGCAQRGRLPDRRAAGAVVDYVTHKGDLAKHGHPHDAPSVQHPCVSALRPHGWCRGAARRGEGCAARESLRMERGRGSMPPTGASEAG